MPYYAVAKGRSVGVYNSWSECENQVKGYSNATFKKFDSASSAREFVSSQSSQGGGGGGGSNYYGASSYSGSSQGGGGSNYYGASSYSGSSYGGGSSSYGDGFERDRNGSVQVYTDGACASNGQDGARAGFGVYWGKGNRLNTSERVRGRQTNNSGEIQAATRALQQAAENGVTDLTINTDSKFLIQSATDWMPGWKQNGWQLSSGGPVKNEKDFRDLDKAQSKLNVKWNYVEGHSGVLGNEKADQLAKAGASKH